MSPALAEPFELAPAAPHEGRGPRLFAAARGGPSLEHVVRGAWEELAAGAGAAACPACGGRMAPEHSADGRLLFGACEGCGARLD